MGIAQIEKTLKIFSTTSDMTVGACDNQFRFIAQSAESSNDFCSCIHSSKKCLDRCIHSDIEAFKKAEQNKSAIMFQCPFGITEAVVPVFDKGEIIIYLISKLGFCSEETHILPDYIKNIAPELNIDIVQKKFFETKSYPREKIEAYFETLKIFAEYMSGKSIYSPESNTVGQLIKKYINNNIEKKITLGELSIHLHRCTVTLTQNFKKEFGISIMEYATKKRIELAKHMLSDGAENTITIAEKCGFSDSEYFYKCFKKETGYTPGQWREYCKKSKKANNTAIF